jgi:hypothetical protein
MTRKRRSHRSVRLGGVAALLAIAQACHGYFGDGPDPAAAGRVDGGAGGGACDPLGSNLLIQQRLGCPALLACLGNRCQSPIDQCFGSEFARGTLHGTCENVLQCVQNCGCGANCLAQCDPSNSCQSCTTNFLQCEHNNCGAESNSCLSGSGGSSGAGGGGGAAGSGGNCTGDQVTCTGATQLVANAQIRDIALRNGDVYFLSNQGLAKIPNTGGTATPMGGFTMVNSFAIEPMMGNVLLVASDGTLTGVGPNGVGMPLGKPQCGGGSGDVALAGPVAYFTSGNQLAMFDAMSMTLGMLTTDVFNNGGSSARIAVDPNNVYYIGALPSGGGNAVIGVARSMTGNPSCGFGNGTMLAKSNGNLSAIIDDPGAQMLVFTDVGSNGLTQVLTVGAIPMPALAPATPVTLASLMPGVNDAINMPGSALASDGTYAYFGSFSGIYRVKIGGPSCAPDMIPCGPAELRVPNAFASAIAVDDTYIYFGANYGPGGLYRIAK